MKRLDDDNLNNVSGGINNNVDIEKKWEKVGIKVVIVNGFAEYYLKDGTKISPSKALEIYLSQGGGESN